MALEQARKDSAERRARADLAATSYDTFLRDVATPVFRMFANVAKAEGHGFAVFTPAGGVRLASERHADDFMEIWLDTTLDSAAGIDAREQGARKGFDDEGGAAEGGRADWRPDRRGRVRVPAGEHRAAGRTMK